MKQHVGAIALVLWLLAIGFVLGRWTAAETLMIPYRNMFMQGYALAFLERTCSKENIFWISPLQRRMYLYHVFSTTPVYREDLPLTCTDLWRVLDLVRLPGWKDGI